LLHQAAAALLRFKHLFRYAQSAGRPVNKGIFIVFAIVAAVVMPDRAALNSVNCNPLKAAHSNHTTQPPHYIPATSLQDKRARIKK
jgi:hypothetical protein